MFSIMKCGHPADCIMTDVPYHDELWSVAACSFCFDHLGTAIQPACNLAEDQDALLQVYSAKNKLKVERNYRATLIGIAAIILSIVILIMGVRQ